MELIDYLRVIYTNRCKSQKTVNILKTIINNILSFPNEEKYREIRLSNKSIHKYIVQVDGVIQFLMMLGFVRTYLPSKDGPLEGYLTLYKPENDDDNNEDIEKKIDTIMKLQQGLIILDKNVGNTIIKVKTRNGIISGVFWTKDTINDVSEWVKSITRSKKAIELCLLKMSLKGTDKLSTFNCKSIFTVKTNELVKKDTEKEEREERKKNIDDFKKLKADRKAEKEAIKKNREDTIKNIEEDKQKRAQKYNR